MATYDQVQTWLANLQRRSPEAANLFRRYSQLAAAEANDPNGEVGRVTAASYRRQRQAINYSPEELVAVRNQLQTQYPEDWQWASQNRAEAGGFLGQGQPVLLALGSFMVGGSMLGGAGAGGTAAGTGTTTVTTGGITAGDVATGVGAAGTAEGMLTPSGTTTTPTTTSVDTSITNPPPDAYFDPNTGTYTTPSGTTTTPTTTPTFTTYDPITGQPRPTQTTPQTPTITTSNGGFWDDAGNWVTSPQGLSTLFNTASGLWQGDINQQTNQDLAAQQLEASRIAAENARFRPVGVTTGFGASQFGYDENGRLVSAGYQLTPEMQRQRDLLIAQSGGLLNQAEGAQQATAPMGTAAQSMFNLGQGYLGTSPQQQAARYMEEQQALLSTGRERQLASLQNQLAQQGRLGLATGATGMMGAANPELEAFYNAQRQQDLGLAAQATQGGMDYARFGAGMVGLGGTTLRDMYGTQQAAYSPYTTALQGATTIERLGQGAMDLGTSIGQQVSTAGVNQGNFITGGQQNAAPYQYNANTYNPWATMLSGAGDAMNQYSNNNQNNQWSY